MKLPQKRMIYHFYVSNDWNISITNKIHFACLKKYAHIFNEVVICLSIDNIEDRATLPQKLLHDGQIYILRSDKTYTTTGAEVK